MSLRLLLADESSSIKKAFELALKDYQVKIQTVHQGTDVQEIFQSFQPDICFMDVMLPKLSGYDTCSVLKDSDSSKNTPVVLMWSGFMELDKNKFESCGANGSIEKPFETKTLRETVQKLLPQLGQNEISSHLIMDEPETEDVSSADFDSLELPDLPADLEASPDLPPLDPALFGKITSEEGTDPDVFADLNAEEDLNLPDLFAVDDDKSVSEESEEWQEQAPSFEAPEGLDDLDSFSVEPLSAITDDDSEYLPFESTPEGLDLPPTPNHQAVEEKLSPQPLNEEVEAATPQEALKDENELIVGSNTEIPQLSKEELKRLILAQSKDIIESVVWDVVPELAKEMIQKEIRRLTGEVKHESDLR